MSISVHREGVNPSSMEGVLDLSDHISVVRLTIPSVVSLSVD